MSGHAQLISTDVRTDRMAFWAVVCAALTTFAVTEVVRATGGTRVLALVFAILGLSCTLLFGVAYVKLRKS